MPKVKPMKTFVEAGVDIKDQSIIKFTTEGEWKESAKFTNADGTPKSQFQIKVLTPENGELLLTLNKNSFNRMIDEFGDDTANWVGKEVRAHVKEENVAGEFRNVIYLTHPNKNLKGQEINA